MDYINCYKQFQTRIASTQFRSVNQTEAELNTIVTSTDHQNSELQAERGTKAGYELYLNCSGLIALMATNPLPSPHGTYGT
jgi:hypothetical protein